MVSPIEELKRPPKPGDPEIRLLWCKTCRKFEELPPFNGHPDDDVTLKFAVHNHPGNGSHIANLISVPAKLMLVAKQQVLKQIAEGSTGLAAFDETIYDVTANFREDAMKCYSDHLRPKGQCPDYCSSKKRLLPNTKADRKELGLADTKEAAPVVYLCNYCPVQMFNEKMRNLETGQYK